MTLISDRTLGNSISSSEIHTLCGPVWIRVEDIQSNQDLVSLEGLRLSATPTAPGAVCSIPRVFPRVLSFILPLSPFYTLRKLKLREASIFISLYKVTEHL